MSSRTLQLHPNELEGIKKLEELLIHVHGTDEVEIDIGKGQYREPDDEREHLTGCFCSKCKPAKE